MSSRPGRPRLGKKQRGASRQFGIKFSDELVAQIRKLAARFAEGKLSVIIREATILGIPALIARYEAREAAKNGE